MINFHETVVGKKFLEGSFPSLVRSVNKSNELRKSQIEISHNLLLAQNKANELKEYELEVNKLLVAAQQEANE